MARFIGRLQGRTQDVTRLGHAATGILAQVRGWHGGVSISGHDDNGIDVFCVRATGGSHNPCQLADLGELRVSGVDVTWIPAKGPTQYLRG